MKGGFGWMLFFVECAVLLEQRLQILGERWILLSDRFEPSSPFLQRNIESLV
jgi:hypothetical protein